MSATKYYVASAQFILSIFLPILVTHVLKNKKNIFYYNFNSYLLLYYLFNTEYIMSTNKFLFCRLQVDLGFSISTFPNVMERDDILYIMYHGTCIKPRERAGHTVNTNYLPFVT